MIFKASMTGSSSMSCLYRGAAIVLLASVWLGAFVAPSVATGQEAVRPPTWSEATHSDEAEPDYDRLFSMDRVHELHIAIAPEDFATMSEDLRTMTPAFPGIRPGGGPPRGRFGPPAGADEGFNPIASVMEQITEATSVCEGEEAGAACSIDGQDGQCTALIGDALMCMPEAAANIAVRGVIGGGGRVPDMIPNDPVYVPVTVTHDGRSWAGVGMRYKGNSSLMTALTSGNGKVPFRLDFDRYEDEMPEIGNQRFYGFHKLTFSSNFSDDSMLKEVLATEVFRDRGVPAARAAFYRVFVDTGEGEQYWGLYTMIEDPADGAMLDAQFGGRGGNLYKPDGPGANWAFFDEEGFEKKTNERDADYSDVIAAIDALHDPITDAQAWREALEAEFDVDLFLRWLAVNSVIENWDSYGRLAHNYYVYGDPGDNGRLKWISWDHNMSFGMAGGAGFGAFRRVGPGGNGFEPGGRFAPTPEFENVIRDGARVFLGGGGGDDILHTAAGPTWPLISRLLADEVYADRYRDELEYALGGLMAPEAFEARARELHRMITPYAIGLDGEQSTHTTLTSEFAFMQALDGPNGLLARVQARRELVREALN